MHRRSDVPDPSINKLAAAGGKGGTHAKRQRSLGGGASSGAPNGSHAAPAASIRCSRQVSTSGRAARKPHRLHSRSALARSERRPFRPRQQVVCAAQPLDNGRGGRNLRTASAVRNFAGASPECEAPGNARGAPHREFATSFVRIWLLNGFGMTDAEPIAGMVRQLSIRAKEWDYNFVWSLSIFFRQHDCQHGRWVVTKSAMAFQPDSRDMLILIGDINAKTDF